MTEPLTIVDVDAAVREVAARLPFPVELAADMGGTFALQIDLGQRGKTDDPRDTAGIDPESNSRWWLDIEGGIKTHVSDLGSEADPAAVAAWITETARAERCPAAVNAARTDAIRQASYPVAPTIGEAAAVPSRPSSTAGDVRRGYER